jgi:hypothetical protein
MGTCRGVGSIRLNGTTAQPRPGDENRSERLQLIAILQGGMRRERSDAGAESSQ